ncbi:MAG: NAD(P)H-hydrate epimerase [Planctomycetota bacterium]
MSDKHQVRGGCSTTAMSIELIRKIDSIAMDKFGVPGIVLMENASRGAAEMIHAKAPRGTVLILAGSGNNGGDGFAIARQLMMFDRSVEVLTTFDRKPTTSDAGINQNICEQLGCSMVTPDDDVKRQMDCFDRAELIIDCLLGTGATGDPRPPAARLIEYANASSAIRFAVDIPTGLDATTGVPGTPTFRADHTITFIAPKPGFESETARPWLGQVHIIGIGVPSAVLLAGKQTMLETNAVINAPTEHDQTGVDSRTKA